MHFNENIKIDNYILSNNNPVFIVGEAGVNHNGSIENAKKLVDIACRAKVDAVKFQMFKSENLVLSNVDKAPYQKKSTDKMQSQYDMLKKLELCEDEYVEVFNYARNQGIIPLCTPFDDYSLDFLDKLNVSAFKVAATDLTNIHFLRKIAKKGRPIILSAGMCYLEEVRVALEAIYPFNRDVILLQCTANYPLENNEVNLNVIDTFKQEFDIIVGYSDHSKGIGAAPYAVAKGAKFIEKHFTIDKESAGPDHKASVTPDELRELVIEIRKVEQYLGNHIKTPTLSESFTRKSLQKCLVTNCKIRKGEYFSKNNVTAKRTGGEGISALYFDYIMGKIVNRDYDENEIIDML
ncbi:N-acetylneuraminate synthase family protein [Lachnospiraceae bacterium C1.1]|nr:N-acetylneuraminate synthase family protein [Lachnospiraceae bacterium C1.1]